jgi:hypothetical protein
MPIQNLTGDIEACEVCTPGDAYLGSALISSRKTEDAQHDADEDDADGQQAKVLRL